MNSFSIALKMFRSNIKTYSFYLAVMIFAVAVYYDFMVLKYDPGFLKAKDTIMAAKVASSVTSFVLVVFLFFFVWYSSSFFLKQRKKEIAIYSLMGTSNLKIGRIFAIESLFTGITSTGIGLAVGILFSRLFLMAVAKVALLDVEIGFSIPKSGVIELLIVFGVIFLVLSVGSFINVSRSKLIDLIRDSATEEKEPKFKFVRAIFSVIFIGVGYYLSKNILMEFIVVVLVVIGTYWLFGALLPTIVKFLSNKKSILYNGVNIISISNISFRIKANYRSLAMLAVMTATTLTAFGTSLSLKYFVDETHNIEFPYTFSYVLDDKTTDDKVVEIIDESKHKLVLDERLEFISVNAKIKAGFGDDSGKYLAIKYSTFRKLSEELGAQYPGKYPYYEALTSKQAFMLVSPTNLGGFVVYQGKTAEIGKDKFNIVQEMRCPLFGSGKLYSSDCLVIPDEEYETVAKGKTVKVFRGFIVTDPKNSLDLANNLLSVMPQGVSLFTYITHYMGTYTFLGMFYFLGSFMSIVFILATGSIMYFKILSEGLADKAKYDILKKIGMTKKEIRKAVSMQVGLSLALPLAVGILHSLFAIDALRNMLGFNLLIPTIAAISIYAVFYGIFYVATTRKFMKLVY